jgi:small-conductance mechanosensitive channel
MGFGYVVHFYNRQGNPREQKNAVKVNNMAIQFQKIGAAVLMFAALTGILYTGRWTDGHIIPAKGNLIHTKVVKEMKKRGAKAQVAQAAMSGSQLAQQVVITHPEEFGLAVRGVQQSGVQIPYGR